jgi:ketosteroid isomerase-like protein
MPEPQNVDVVQEAYAAFGRGDIPGLLSLLDADIPWVTPGPSDLPTAGRRRGHAAVGEFFTTLVTMADITRFEPQDFIAQGDKVVVLGEETAVIKATGATLENRWVHIFTVSGGKIVAFEEVFDATPIVSELRSAAARLGGTTAPNMPVKI